MLVERFVAPKFTTLGIPPIIGKPWRPLKGIMGETYRASYVFCRFLILVCNKHVFSRFLRIHFVHGVINSPTQLSGRGFPDIFDRNIMLSHFYVFLVLPN